jgi:dUTP pyrophosphatase
MTISIKFKKLVPDAQLPTKGKPGDAAYDLYSCEKVRLFPGQTRKVRTGLQLADMPLEDGPDLLFLQIEGRSGVATRGVYPIGGIVDGSYRGEIQVILHNGNPLTFSYNTNSTSWSVSCDEDKEVFINPGDRIAQIIVRRTPKDVLMEETEEVTETSRGASGFGSTGT